MSDQFITDLSKTFENIRKFKWKLNPTKCVFGIPSGKLLSFIVSSRGPPRNKTTPKAIQTTTLDVGYYAPRGPNLSKSLCSFHY